MVGADNWAHDNYSMKLWDFSRQQLKGIEVYRAANWTTGGPNHVSHLNAKPDVPPKDQYVCGSGANKTNEARGNELVCFRLDGSYDTLIVAPIMTDVLATGGRTDYYKQPKANLDVTGQYAVWTSNMGTNRMDAFIAKIPSQLLMASRGTDQPMVWLMALVGGALILGSIIVVLANAYRVTSAPKYGVQAAHSSRRTGQAAHFGR
jgi:hypothetical protein